jgi:hypothetical protein
MTAIVAVLPGKHRFYRSIVQACHGRGRIANDLAAYELYRGVDADVNFSTPYETFASLPHVTGALAAGHAYKFALRKRNDYNLLSQNIEAWELALDGDGAAIVTKPAAPVATMAADAGGTAKIGATYDYVTDGDDQANQWLIYLTSNGSDPDPDEDTPTVLDMAKADGLARLNYISAAFSEGATVKAIVRARRAADDADSTNINILTATATLLGPSMPMGGIV